MASFNSLRSSLCTVFEAYVSDNASESLFVPSSFGVSTPNLPFPLLNRYYEFKLPFGENKSVLYSLLYFITFSRLVGVSMAFALSLICHSGSLGLSSPINDSHHDFFFSGSGAFFSSVTTIIGEATGSTG